MRERSHVAEVTSACGLLAGTVRAATAWRCGKGQGAGRKVTAPAYTFSEVMPMAWSW